MTEIDKKAYEEMLRDREKIIETQQGEIESYRARLKHLLQSGYIAMFDMKDPKTGEYARDIRDADTLVEQLKKNADNPAGNLTMYKCDRRACKTCSYPKCKYTSDIRHAERFKLNGLGAFVETGVYVEYGDVPNMLESDGN